MRRLHELLNVVYSTDLVEYSSELALDWNMSHLIDLNVSFYMYLIRQFKPHLKVNDPHPSPRLGWKY